MLSNVYIYIKKLGRLEPTVNYSRSTLRTKRLWVTDDSYELILRNCNITFRNDKFKCIMLNSSRFSGT